MHMTHVWLSPSLPADPGAMAGALGPGYEVLPPSAEPPFGDDQPGDNRFGEQPSAGVADDGLSEPRPQRLVQPIIVATIYERELLAALVARPGDARLVLVTPPGVDVPPDLGAQVRPQMVGSASSVADVVALIRAVPADTSMDVLGPAGADAPWWAGAGRPEIHSAAGPADLPTAAQPTAGGGWRFGRRFGRRGGLIAAGAILAVVLGTSAAVMAAAGGGNSGSQTVDAASPGGLPSYGPGRGRFPGGGGFGEGGMPGDRFLGGDRFQDGDGPAIDLEKFQACLKDKGIILDGGNGQPRPDMRDSKVRAAFRQCMVDAGGAAAPAGAPGDDQPGDMGGPAGAASGTSPAKPTTFVASAATLT